MALKVGDIDLNAQQDVWVFRQNAVPFKDSHPSDNRHGHCTAPCTYLDIRNACVATQRIAIVGHSFFPFDVNLTSLQITLNAARRPTYLLTPAPPAARPLVFCHCSSEHSLLPKTSLQLEHTHYKLRLSFHLRKTASPTFTTLQFPSADTSGEIPVCEYSADCLSHKRSSSPFLRRRHNPSRNHPSLHHIQRSS